MSMNKKIMSMAVAASLAVSGLAGLAYAISAYPAGVISDRFGRQVPLLAGIVFLILADIILARANDL